MREVENVRDIDLYEAFNITCLFLAQADEPQPTSAALGFSRQQDAFKAIGALFDKAPNTVKLTRDAFDRYTNSPRVGWEGELRPALKAVFDKYGELGRDELLDLAKNIIAMMKEDYSSIEERSRMDLFSQIANADSKTSVKPVYFGTVVNFSNTTGNWFAVTIQQIENTLKDILENLDAFKKAGVHYEESAWRLAFRTHLNDDVAAALAATQTLPFFDLLAKIIHYSTSNTEYKFKEIELESDKLQIALNEINKISTREKPAGAEQLRRHDSSRLTGGVNRIFYGAPGTGKSHEVNRLTEKAGHEVVRTVFHPDVQNSDFVGSLKPVISDGEITYQFSPGPFARALVAAVANPEKHVSLIIEELNRAPAAAVFGELFLLLDRDTNGQGEYDSDFPSEEFMFWYQNQTGTSVSKMRLPSNLSIYATMNSADQGVYPLDTAFRRRWLQDYVKIDYDNAPSGNILVCTEKGKSTPVKWTTFIEILNEHLSALPFIEEDRLIGPWFIKQTELEEDISIPGKLLIYLWDDLLRHDGRDTVFATEKFSTYGSLSSASEEGFPILSESLLAKFELNSDHDKSNEQ